MESNDVAHGEYLAFNVTPTDAYWVFRLSTQQHFRLYRVQPSHDHPDGYELIFLSKHMYERTVYGAAERDSAAHQLVSKWI